MIKEKKGDRNLNSLIKKLFSSTKKLFTRFYEIQEKDVIGGRSEERKSKVEEKHSNRPLSMPSPKGLNKYLGERYKHYKNTLFFTNFVTQ